MAAKKKPNDRAKATSLDSLFSAYSKMGVTVVEEIEAVERIPTGILSVDMVLHGGLPRGRMILHYGEEGSGKSTTWMLIARNLIQRGKRVLWLDAERAFEREYSDLLGIDVNAVDSKGERLLTLIKVQTAEQAIDAVIMALEIGAFDLIVLDSLAKLVPATEAGSSVSKAGMGDASRLYSRATRVWGPALDESGTALVVLNQERLEIGVYGAPKTNPGGKAITKHEPSVILFSGRNANVYGADAPQKLVFRYVVKKSKVFPSALKFKTDDFYQLHIRCGSQVYEIDYPHELYHAAKSLALLQDKDGGEWKNHVAYFQGEKLANGDEAVQAFFDAESALRDRIEQAIHLAMTGGNYGTTGTAGSVPDDDAGDPGQEEREAETTLDLFGGS